jgi:hypothetical protein
LIRYLLLLLGAVASPVSAQKLEGIWKGSGDRIAAPPANVSFPRSVGGLGLTATAEASHKGEALDNTAEYRSADHKIWGTIYVYRPGYPDAAIAAYMTDRAIRLTYGDKLKRLSQTVVPIGGQPSAAIRITYSGGVIEDSGPLASAAAFAHVNGWILVFRVSGPIDRPAEVEAALDAMLAATKFDRKAYILPAAPLEFAAPCPAATSGPVKPFKSDESGANALMAALSSSVGAEKPKGKNEDLKPNFPANGLTRVCVRGTLGDSGLEILQPAGTSTPEVILLPLNDVDDVVTVQKNLMGAGYTLSKTDIGQTMVLGEIDRMPDNDQLARILAGEQKELLAVRSTTTIKANGNTSVNISTGTLK